MSNRRLVLNLAFFLLSGAALLCAQSTPKTTLLALSKQDHTLAIINPATLKVLAVAPVGDDPHEVIASADGTRAYVSNYGFGAFHTLAVIDLVAQKPLPQIDLGALNGPHGLDFQAGKLWFTAEAARAIGSYDPATNKINWIMGTGQDRTHMIYVFPDAKKILTTNVTSATVTVMEKRERKPGDGPMGMPPPPPNGSNNQGPPPMPPSTGGDWQLTVIPVGAGAEGFDVSPDGKEAWVANAHDGTVSIIDLATRKVTATLAADVRGANRLKFTPDGKHVLISAQSALVVFDASTHQVLKRLNNIHGTGGIQMQPDGKLAYIACGRDNYVVAIDLATWTAVGKVTIASPDGLAWAIQQ